MLIAFVGCESGKRERALRQRETALDLREQEVLAREQELGVREAAFAQRLHAMDSTARADTNRAPQISGTWNVQMTCTETTCAGSAVGDTKTEQWNFNSQGQTIIVRATAKGQLERLYTGTYAEGLITLSEERASAASSELARMTVRLKPIDATHMQGQREILRENDCRIVYALQLDAATQ